jgi:NAD(P)-dependent dehydrogenase (short-subunit alcohol dehydrogenase family)
MLMSAIEGARSAARYPEFAGKRILITGLSSSCGVDIVRAFAEHKTRLILQFDEMSEKMQAIAEIAVPHALDIKAFGPVDRTADEVVQFARQAAQTFGGLDTVINLIPLELAHLDASASTCDVERIVAARLLLPCLLSKVAANRMAISWNEGLILNIATLAPAAQGPSRAFAAVTKAALAAMTRGQAEEWADKAIRLNAIAPPAAQEAAGPGAIGEPDIAALALYLASGRDKSLSGHVFEAEPAKHPPAIPRAAPR